MSSSAQNQSQAAANELGNTASGLPSVKTAEDSETSSRDNIDNEITGTKLLLLHIGLCLATFITGLVSWG